MLNIVPMLLLVAMLISFDVYVVGLSKNLKFHLAGNLFETVLTWTIFFSFVQGSKSENSANSRITIQERLLSFKQPFICYCLFFAV